MFDFTPVRQLRSKSYFTENKFKFNHNRSIGNKYFKSLREKKQKTKQNKTKQKSNESVNKKKQTNVLIKKTTNINYMKKLLIIIYICILMRYLFKINYNKTGHIQYMRNAFKIKYI